GLALAVAARDLVGADDGACALGDRCGGHRPPSLPAGAQDPGGHGVAKVAPSRYRPVRTGPVASAARAAGRLPTLGGGARRARACARGRGRGPALRGDAGELGDDLAAVGLERLLLAVRHQVDVELADADGLELAQLPRAVAGRPDHAEAVADLVGDELAVLRADAGVVLVVVELARLDEVGQLRRDVGVPPVAL